MRGALLIALLVAAVGCGTGEAGSTGTPPTALTISLFPEGSGPGTAAPTVRTLRCNPPAGTLPRRDLACARLARASAPFAPLREDVACTDIYGGPQEAVVAGRFRGRRIWVALSLRNGCEIARWNTLRYLVGSANAGS